MKLQTPLSPRQVDFVQAVSQLTRACGFAPSLWELAVHMGISVSRAHKLAVETAARGHVIRDERIPRSIRIPTPEEL